MCIFRSCSDRFTDDTGIAGNEGGGNRFPSYRKRPGLGELSAVLWSYRVHVRAQKLILGKSILSSASKHPSM